MSRNKASAKLLITLEYPPDIGGIGFYYKQMVLHDPNLTVIKLTPPRRKFGWVQFIGPVWRRMSAERASELQVGQVLPLGYLALFFKFARRCPYIVYVHGLDVLQRRLNGWKRFWIKLILWQASRIISNSHFVKEQTVLLYALSPEKFQVIHPTIDLTAITGSLATHPALNRPAGVKIILSVGRLVERKGFDRVIEALGDINVAADWRYWIIGDGPDRERLLGLVAKYNLTDKVEFLGAVPEAWQLYQYYQASDIFVMVSREINGDVEGFGIVFLEAGVFSKPVIGGRSGGVPEAVIDGVTGLLVDPNNVAAIRAAIVKLLTDEALAKQLGQQGYDRLKS